MSLTLSTEEVVELSGYVHKNKQIESIMQMGFRCWVNGAGRVIVLRSELLSEKAGEEPNFEAL